MRTGFKKWWPLSTISILGMGLLSADVRTADASGMTDLVVNPSARLMKKPGWFVTGEILLWQAHEDGLAPAVTNKDCIDPDFVPNSKDSLFTNGNLKHLDFHWDVGSRIGIGYNLCHDEWDIYSNWTYFQDGAHRHLSANECVKGGRCCDNAEQNLYATFSAVNPGFIKNIQVDYAAGSWNFILNMLDFELGRKFFVGKWLSIRPNIGLRSAWVHQHYHVRYSGGELNNLGAALDFHIIESDSELINVSTIPDQIDFISMRNNYWGIGPRFGIDTQWNFLREWSVFGDAAISILFGNFKVEQDERLGCTPIPISFETTIIIDGFVVESETENGFLDNKVLHVEDSFHAIRMITDLTLGLRWEHFFCQEKYKVMVSVGWEHHLFLHQNQLKHYVTEGRHVVTSDYGSFDEISFTRTDIIPDSDKNLSTQGVTFAVRFDF